MASGAGFGLGSTGTIIAASAAAIAVAVGGTVFIQKQRAARLEPSVSTAAPDQAGRLSAERAVALGPAPAGQAQGGAAGQGGDGSPQVAVTTPAAPGQDGGGGMSAEPDQNVSATVIGDGAATPQAAGSTPAVTGPATAPQPADQGIPRPRFDLVRVEGDGSAVIAGKSAAGLPVRILDGDRVLAEAVPDRTGSFVVFLDLDRPGQPRALTLETVAPDGAVVASEESVLVTPPAPAAAPAPQEAAGTAVASATPDTGAEAQADGGAKAATASAEPAATTETGPAAGTATGESTETAAVDQSDGAAGSSDTGTEVAEAEARQAPAVVVASPEGVRVLQPPAGTAQDGAPANVSIDTISYDERGEVVLSGRGRPGQFVRIYVDNRPVKTQRIGEDGVWTSDLAEVDAGRYTLRVDEIDASGRVTSRAETPFQKEFPADVRRVLAGEAGETGGAADDGAGSGSAGQAGGAATAAETAAVETSDGASGGTAGGTASQSAATVAASKPAAPETAGQQTAAIAEGQGAGTKTPLATETQPAAQAATPEATAEATTPAPKPASGQGANATAAVTAAPTAAPTGTVTETAAAGVTVTGQGTAADTGTAAAAQEERRSGSETAATGAEGATGTTAPLSAGAATAEAEGSGNGASAAQPTASARSQAQGGAAQPGVPQDSTAPAVETEVASLGPATQPAAQAGAGEGGTASASDAVAAPPAVATPSADTRPAADVQKPAAPAPEASAPSRPHITSVTVQPGYTLWAIARDTYGEGRQYVRIYSANKKQIRDPDLIYPGQIFSVPE